MKTATIAGALAVAVGAAVGQVPGQAMAAAEPGPRPALAAAGLTAGGLTAGQHVTSPWDASKWDTAANGGTSLASVAASIGATSSAASGLTGAGVGVALIDTGVAQVPGLPAVQIVNGPDLSFESQSANTRYLDTYGHGTHMAGIIMGNDTAAGFKGIAPGAKLTSIKAGGSQGAVDVTQVMAALDWVVQHRNDDPKNPIRVVNLSYGSGGVPMNFGDPDVLALAARNAWKAGLVVVVSAGNKGSTTALDDPGFDSFLLTVGSVGTKGTASQADDTVSTFSSSVSTGRNADLVAPGESIASLRDPNGAADLAFPSARVGTKLFKGTGSSQAAAVVTGAVALLLQKRPALTPDQVKATLKATATQLPVAGSTTKLGEINLAAALPAATVNTVQSIPRPSAFWAYDTARGGSRVKRDAVGLSGYNAVWGPQDPCVWESESFFNRAWSGGTWLGLKIAADGWTGSSWASKTWGTVSWAGTPWSAASSWYDDNWSGRFWSNGAWDGRFWSGRYWSSDNWSTATWG